jgi:hypothetical protein
MMKDSHHSHTKVRREGSWVRQVRFPLQFQQCSTFHFMRDTSVIRSNGGILGPGVLPLPSSIPTVKSSKLNSQRSQIRIWIWLWNVICEKRKQERFNVLRILSLSLTKMLQLFRAILCGLMFCTHEYPSDPLASRRFASRSLSLHTSYDSLFNNDLELDSKVNLSPITQTNSGAVEGYVMRSIKGRRFCAYEGIPYGESTGGPNRFKVLWRKPNF